jgi:PAS domain S-box-containing protein
MSEVPRSPDAAPHLDAIVEWSDDAIISKDLRGIITSWNRAAERMFGYTAAEVLGRSITILIPPERFQEEEHVLRQVMAGLVVDHFETERVTKDGRTIEISLTVSPIKDEEGNIVGASKIARDITERKQAEKAHLQLLRERSQVQQDTVRMKDEFLAMLSHELRTPLASIMGWTELLLTGELSDEQEREALETIRRNVRTQSTILGDLLDLSRITQGLLRIEPVPLDLERIVRDAVAIAQPSASAKRIEIGIHPRGEAFPILGDGLRLQQVVGNILSNAIKFTPAGGRVDVRLERDGGRVRASFTDTGEGITPDVLPHVFSRFRQGNGSHATRSHGGLGLGLALVREIVEIHGGTASIASEGRGKGTTVVLDLPENVAAEVPAAAPEARVFAARRSFRGLRILVVDDRLDDRELLKVILRQPGADVRTAETAKEALESLEAWRPHLLISDLAMPDEGGFALIAKVRGLADPELRRVPAIAVTAHLGNEDRAQARAAGFDHFLTKPIDREQLFELVGQTAERRASERSGP